MAKNELLQWLLDRDGLNTLSLSTRLKGATTQSQIHRFLHGKVKEAKRTTLAPVADYFGIPLDAFYYPDIAAEVLDALKSGNSIKINKQPRSGEREIALLADWLNEIQNVKIRTKAVDDCMKIVLEARNQESNQPTHGTVPAASHGKQHA